MKTSLFVKKGRGGMFAIVDNKITTGDVFFVDSNTGTDGTKYGKNPDAPFATIDYAIGQCTASKGDIIYVMPFHAETVTAAITADVIGISIIGLCAGTRMPVITGNGAIDALTVTAADVHIANLKFAAPLTDAQTADINIAAARCSVVNTVHLGSVATENKVNVITITSAGNDFLLDGVRIYNDVVEVPAAISIEGACARGEIRNCFVIGGTTGFTSGCLIDGAAATQLYVHHNVFKNTKATVPVVSFANNSTGVCSFNHMAGRHTTIASNFAVGTGMDVFENRVTEEAALNGMIMPAADAD